MRGSRWSHWTGLRGASGNIGKKRRASAGATSLAKPCTNLLSLLERGQRNPGYEITMKLIGALRIEADDASL